MKDERSTPLEPPASDRASRVACNPAVREIVAGVDLIGSDNVS